MNPDLAKGWTTFKSGMLWRAYAKENPKESKRLDSFVAALSKGTEIPKPMLGTATGIGLYKVIKSLIGRRAVVSHVDLEVPTK